MQKRHLGRTKLQVSIVGFGGTWISRLAATDANAVVKRAFDLGINYFDTARWNGDSEEKMGVALEDIRDECIIATKTGARTKHTSLEDLRGSLRKLRTDRMNIIHLQGIDDEKTLAKAIGVDGSLELAGKHVPRAW